MSKIGFSIDELKTLWVAVGAFGPGFIILVCRDQFVTGRLPKFSEAAYTYLVSSVLYYLLVGPVILYLAPLNNFDLIVVLGILPFISGVGLGAMHQHSPLSKLWDRLGVIPVHSSPTSWDYVFPALKDAHFVIVHLKDGRVLHGYFADRSFASSILEYRDLYIERLLTEEFKDIDDGRAHGLWIDGDEIGSVEFIADT